MPRGEPAQEGAVVRDEEERPPLASEELLEPRDGLHVEVVRRLVEEQQVGVRGQRARQQHAALESGRERRHVVRRVEAHARDRRLDGAAQVGLVAAAPSATTSRTVPASEAGTCCGRLATRSPGGLRTSPSSSSIVPWSALQQRRLARAVATEQAEPLPALQVQVRSVEHGRDRRMRP